MSTANPNYEYQTLAKIASKFLLLKVNQLVWIISGCLLVSSCGQLALKQGSAISNNSLKPTLETNFQPKNSNINTEKSSISNSLTKDGLGNYSDVLLNQVIEQALLENTTIVELKALVVQAEQQVIIIEADQGFNLSLASANTVRKDTVNSGSNRSYDLALNASLPLDIWGNLKADSQAVHYQLAIAKTNLKQAQNSLVADITSAWYQLVYHAKDYGLRQEQESNTRNQLATIESAYKQGLKQSLDVYLARENLESASARVLVQAHNLANASRTLELLLSKYPSGKYRVASNFPILTDDYLLGIPADLLVNRADLNSKWLGVLAEDASAASRYAQQFPQFNLTGNLSLTSARLADLFKQNLAWSLMANISQSVFDNGKKQAIYQQAKAKLIAKEQQYLAALQNAFKEVETLLDSEKSIQQQWILNQKALNNAQHAFDQVTIQYQNGIADYQQVLTIQDRVYARQQAQLDQQIQMINNRIDLLLALGSKFLKKAALMKQVQKKTIQNKTVLKKTDHPSNNPSDNPSYNVEKK